MFKAGVHPGFTEVESKNAQIGDVVVQGGHAEIFIGRDANGTTWALANNGTPSGSVNGYQDKPTKRVRFTTHSCGAGAVHFYRALEPKN